VACVDKAIAKLKSNGTLHRLQQQYLQIYLKVPVIQP
jgi:ABC-type amino acid transport substrate-binding protein